MHESIDTLLAGKIECSTVPFSTIPRYCFAHRLQAFSNVTGLGSRKQLKNLTISMPANEMFNDRMSGLEGVSWHCERRLSCFTAFWEVSRAI